MSVVTHNNESKRIQRDESKALIKLVCDAYGFIHLTRTVIGNGPQFNPGTILPILSPKARDTEVNLVYVSYEKG
jgi:hypothetical protein